MALGAALSAPSLSYAQFTPYQTVSATVTGPLTSIFVGADGSLQIAHILDAFDYQVYPPDSRPGDYGTMIAIGGLVHGPNFDANEEGSATGSMSGEANYRYYVAGMQTGVLGTGTPLDPFQVITTYSATVASIDVVETTSYVVGQESFLTTVRLTNTGTAARSGHLYRAADCYLGGSDSGYGFYDGASGAIACSQNPDNSPQGRIEQWLPITPGSNYFQSGYSTVWSQIALGGPFPDTCECQVQIDNGAGLSWPFTIAPGASTTIAHLTTFSVVGNVPVTTLKTADTATVTTGAMNGYTLYFDNPNIFPVTVTDVVDTLPDGFAYVPGSTTGLIAVDPLINGQILSWSGATVIPAQTTGMMHFDVVVGTSTGTFYNNAGGLAAGGITIAPTGPTAAVVVILPTTPDAGVSVDGAVVDAAEPLDAGGQDDGGLVADAGVADTGTTPGDDSGTTPGDDSGTTPGDDSGTTPGDDSGTSVDSGSVADSGTTPADAGTTPRDAGSGSRDDGDGCSCSTAHDAGSEGLSGALAMMLVLGLALRRRR
ncbi:MYXO-CTERM sorting domain-containing protein [Myxococcota bacterium]|nr:MYXO-CTERM sorting domain-containing protein [Myxococcota bacterium]